MCTRTLDHTHVTPGCVGNILQQETNKRYLEETPTIHKCTRMRYMYMHLENKVHGTVTRERVYVHVYNYHAHAIPLLLRLLVQVVSEVNTRVQTEYF